MSAGGERPPVNPISSAGWFPLVGAMIGAAVGAAAATLVALHVPRLAASALALGLGALLTGGMHEDGLADVADGFGGGWDRTRKLAIMRDSRLGTYGALALLVSFSTRAVCLASFADHQLLPGAVVAFAIPRTTMVIATSWLPFAREDGLAAGAGRAPLWAMVTSAAVAAAIALMLLPWPDALTAAGSSLAAGLCVALLARRQIGGQTGDVVGAAEQVGEMVVLLALVARHP